MSFVFPSNLAAPLVLKSKSALPWLSRLLSNERESILGEALRPKGFFGSQGTPSMVSLPLKVKEVLWDIHNHPGGWSRPSLADLISASDFGNKEMSIINPIKQQMLQIYDPNMFEQADKSVLSRYVKSPFANINPTSPLLSYVQDFVNRKLLQDALGSDLIYKQSPLFSHPLFKDWLNAISP